MPDLNDNFKQALNDVQGLVRRNSRYFYAQTVENQSQPEQRRWMIPSNSASPFDPTAISSLGDAFNRDDLNQEYSDHLKNGVTNNGGMMANIIGVGLQLNYLAVMERAFRERHKTPVRQLRHLLGRAIAHGDTKSVHVKCVQDYVQGFLDSATGNEGN